MIALKTELSLIRRAWNGFLSGLFLRSNRSIREPLGKLLNHSKATSGSTSPFQDIGFFLSNAYIKFIR